MKSLCVCLKGQSHEKVFEFLTWDSSFSLNWATTSPMGGMWWLSGDVVAQWGCGGSVGMWWLSGDVVAQWGCGSSVGMWWLRVDVVAQRGCGGSEGMWWLRGDVVAQLVKATVLHQTATQQFRVRSRHPPQSPEGRQELWLCMIK
jgi:hypothetical protein